MGTPCVNLLWYLTFTKQKEKPIFLYNGLTLLFLFTLCRILFIPYSFYQLASLRFCANSGNEVYRWGAWVMAFGYGILFIMNLIWWQKMVRGAMKKLCGPDNRMIILAVRSQATSSFPMHASYKRARLQVQQAAHQVSRAYLSASCSKPGAAAAKQYVFTSAACCYTA